MTHVIIELFSGASAIWLASAIWDYNGRAANYSTIAAGLAVSGVIDVIHAIASMGETPATTIPVTWAASSAILLFAARLRRAQTSFWVMFAIVGLLCMGSFLVPPRFLEWVVIEDWPYRPLDAMLVIGWAAVIGDLMGGTSKRKIMLPIPISRMLASFAMLFSAQVEDAMFMVAHGLKLGGILLCAVQIHILMRRIST